MAALFTPPRVLYVDAHDGALREFRDAMKPLSIWLAFATSVHEAKARIKAQPYDLVIADEELPDGSGFELLIRLRDAREETRVMLYSNANVSGIAQSDVPVLFRPATPAVLAEVVGFAIGLGG